MRTAQAELFEDNKDGLDMSEDEAVRKEEKRKMVGFRE